MRLLISIALLLTLSLRLNAEITAEGLPAGPAVLMHFSNTSLAETQLGAFLRETFLQKAYPSIEAQAIEEKLGFDPLRDLKEVVAGLYRDNTVAKNKTKAVILLRGKFDLKRLVAQTRKTATPCNLVDTYPTWDMAEWVASLNQEPVNKSERGKLILVAYAEDCLVLASPELIHATLACLQQKKPSCATPLAIAALNLTPTKPWMVFYTDFSKIRAKGFLGEMGEKGMHQTLISINENGRNIQLRGEAEFTTPEQAEAACQEFKQMIKMTSLILLSQKYTLTSASPTDHYLLDLLNGLTVSRVGYLTKIRGDFPTVKAAQAIRVLASENRNMKVSREVTALPTPSE